MPRIQRNTKGCKPRVNKTARKETSISERVYVTVLCEREGKSTHEVLKETGLPQSTVQRIVKHARENALQQYLPLQDLSNYASTHRSGRPQALSSHEKDKIVEKVIENGDTRDSQVEDLLKSMNLQISPELFDQVLYDRGYAWRKHSWKPALSQKQKDFRLEWALEHRDFDWHQVIFTDETAVKVGEQRGFGRTWRKPDKIEKFHPDVMRKRHTKHSELQFWGCFAYDARGPCYVYHKETEASFTLNLLCISADISGRQRRKRHRLSLTRRMWKIFPDTRLVFSQNKA